MSDPLPLDAWLIEAGLASLPIGELFDGFCRRLVVAGVPLARGFLSTGALHPLLRANSFTWQDGRIADVAEFSYDYMQTPAWHASPFRHMMETRTPRLHHRLSGSGALDFPVLSEFRAAGLTHLTAVSGGNVVIITGAVLAALRRTRTGVRSRALWAAGTIIVKKHMSGGRVVLVIEAPKDVAISWPSRTPPSSSASSGARTSARRCAP